MNRREFTKMFGVGIASLPFLGKLPTEAITTSGPDEVNVLRAVQVGDHLSFIDLRNAKLVEHKIAIERMLVFPGDLVAEHQGELRVIGRAFSEGVAK